MYRLKKDEGIEFVHGPGKRKTALQKSIETLEQSLEKLKEYTKKLYICGDRNSYSKTDQDATFMRMKDDAMGERPTQSRIQYPTWRRFRIYHLGHCRAAAYGHDNADPIFKRTGNICGRF